MKEENPHYFEQAVADIKFQDWIFLQRGFSLHRLQKGWNYYIWNIYAPVNVFH